MDAAINSFQYWVANNLECRPDEIPYWKTTEEIKNEDILCKEWVQKWRYDVLKDEINSLRKELSEAQKEHAELKNVIKTLMRHFH